LKISIILILCIFLPPIGIPWLGYELWKNHVKKNDNAVWNKISEKMGPLKSDYKSQEAYLSVVENEIRIFEDAWLNGELFKNIPSDVRNLSFNRRIWSKEKYEKLSLDITQTPKKDLIEYWQYQINKQEDSWISMYDAQLNLAEITKSKILKEIRKGLTWQSILDGQQTSIGDCGVKVSYEDDTWTISFGGILNTLVSKDWYASHGPYFIKFKSFNGEI
jgi:hypothetical protein